MIQINRFPEYAHLSDDYEKKSFDRHPEMMPLDPSQSELQSVVYAPDPVTGLPTTDIARIMSADSNPQVAQFIRDNLMAPNPNYQPGVDDPDLALELVPRDGENFEQFSDRLRQSTRSYYDQFQSSQQSSEPSAQHD